MQTLKKNLLLFSQIFMLLLLSGCGAHRGQNYAPTPGYHPEVISETGASAADTGSFTTAAANPELASKKVFLLLPMHGPLGGNGAAIQHGFFIAYKYAKNQGTPTPQIKVLDTSDADIKALYQDAINQGANLIVGPLSKTDVTTMLSIDQITIPVLALNTVDNYEQSIKPNLYQFGLAPQDEARQIAEKMRQDGLKNVLVIVPKSDWGQNLAAIFTSGFTSLDGTVIAQMDYDDLSSITHQIATLLDVDSSIERTRELGRTLNRKLQASLRRRQDFDAVFLVATPSAARQIKPMLNFYYANTIPVYATSLVYSGTPNATLDSDLNGIIFCDSPWVLQDQASLPPYLQAVQNQLTTLGSNLRDQNNKLFALGIDAYNLSTFLLSDNGIPNSGIAGATGILYLDNYQHLFRHLKWAEFQQGLPVLSRSS